MKISLLIISIFYFSENVFSQSIENSPTSTVYLMIFASDVNYEKYQEQLLLLSKDPLGLDKRNISILEIFPEGGLEADGSTMETTEAEKLRNDYNIKEKDFRIILVTKERIILINQDLILDCKYIFNAIDSVSLK